MKYQWSSVGVPHEWIYVDGRPLPMSETCSLLNELDKKVSDVEWMRDNCIEVFWDEFKDGEYR